MGWSSQSQRESCLASRTGWLVGGVLILALWGGALLGMVAASFVDSRSVVSAGNFLSNRCYVSL